MTTKTRTPSDAGTSRGGKARRDGLSASISYSTTNTKRRSVVRGQLCFAFDSSLPNPSDLSRFKNQRTDIIAWLLDGNSITQDQARYLYGIMRLASRVSELRAAGWNINRTMIQLEGSTARVAEYRLDAANPRST